ncbi:hypothetical protein GOX01_06920 [Gluconobacter oxydans]|nr:hypothetical protein GOX01_06920 [Gluconobacter oxydans]
MIAQQPGNRSTVLTGHEMHQTGRRRFGRGHERKLGMRIHMTFFLKYRPDPIKITRMGFRCLLLPRRHPTIQT